MLHLLKLLAALVRRAADGQLQRAVDGFDDSATVTVSAGRDSR
jgi:hypothetical protein